ncbi:MAG: hypothetical protein WCL13_02360 [bacterium]
MKKLFLLVLVVVILALGVSVGQSASVEVTSDTELVLLPDNGIRGACVSAKLAWDGQKWIRQVGSYKAGFVVPSNHPAWQHAKSLVPPQRVGSVKWEPYGWALYDCDGKVISGAATTTETVTKTTVTAAAPAPANNLQADLDALKAKLAAAEAAEAKRLKDAAAAKRTAKPAPAVKKAPAVSPLAACKANLQTLQDEKAAADKTIGECQTALIKARADLETANSNWRTSEAYYKNALAKCEKTSLGFIPVLMSGLIGLFCGVVIGVLFARRKKTTP